MKPLTNEQLKLQRRNRIIGGLLGAIIAMPIEIIAILVGNRCGKNTVTPELTDEEKEELRIEREHQRQLQIERAKAETEKQRRIEELNSERLKIEKEIISLGGASTLVNRDASEPHVISQRGNSSGITFCLY